MKAEPPRHASLKTRAHCCRGLGADWLAVDVNTFATLVLIQVDLAGLNDASATSSGRAGDELENFFPVLARLPCKNPHVRLIAESALVTSTLPISLVCEPVHFLGL